MKNVTRAHTKIRRRYVRRYGICIEQRRGRNNDGTNKRRRTKGRTEKKRKNKGVKGESQPLALAGRRDPIGILAGTWTPSSANSARIMLSLYSYHEMRLEVQISSPCCDPKVQPREEILRNPLISQCCFFFIEHAFRIIVPVNVRFR